MKGTRILLCLAAMLAMGFARNLPAAQGKYDPPNFDQPVFEVDGLSMPPKACEEVVEALAALARNFPADSQVDSDLMEKALAIALRLDPFHPGAREAHSALSQGNALGKTGIFESRTAISEALWQRAARLAAPDAEPDDALLAPYLMELSLLAHPDPSPDRRRQFAALVQSTPPLWEKFVTLQPEENGSSLRAATLVTVPQADRPPPAATVEASAESEPDAEADKTDEIRLPQTEIGFVACDANGTSSLGIVRLTIRGPDSAGESQPGDPAASGAPANLELKLAPDPKGPPFRGSETIEAIVRKRFPAWPKNKVGELTFSPETGDPPGELALSLAGSLLLESALSGEKIAPDVIIAGVLDENGVSTLGAPGSALPGIVSSAARLTDKPYLLLPASVDIETLAGQDAPLGVKPQVIGFASYDELRSLVLEEKRGLNCREAVGHFASIVEMAEPMGLENVLQDDAVKDRLELILSLLPNHLSAKAMLARHARASSGMTENEPDSPGSQSSTMPDAPAAAADGMLSGAQSNAQIHEALMPLVDFANDDAVTPEAGLQQIRRANETLAALRPRIDASSLNVFLAAQRIVKGFEDLAASRVRDSTAWNRRLDELRDLASEYHLEQAALGSDHRLDL